MQAIPASALDNLPDFAKKKITEIQDKLDNYFGRARKADAPSNVGRGVWNDGPGIRGEIIEKRLGQNLPQNYPTIDRFENGIATSIKSMDLGAPTFENVAAITRTGQGYIDKVASFKPKPWAGVDIKPSQITGRGLDLAVPPGATAAQRQALLDLVQYGRTKGVSVKIVELQ
jgi:filamentous hemagglutinin